MNKNDINVAKGSRHLAPSTDSLQAVVRQANSVSTAVARAFPAVKSDDQADGLRTAEDLAAAREVLAGKYATKDELIEDLESLTLPGLSEFIQHLHDCKIKTDIRPKTLFKFLMKYIIKLIGLNGRSAIDEKKLYNGRWEVYKKNDCENFQFFLAMFDFNPNTEITFGDYQGYTILMLASESVAKPHLLQLLVEDLGGDITCVYRDGTRQGRTALHMACHRGNLDGVKLLLAKGADINAGKITPLGEALSQQQTAVADYLLTQPLLDVEKLSGGVAPLLLAAEFSTARHFITLVAVRGLNPNVLGANDNTVLHATLLKSVDNIGLIDVVKIVTFLLNSPRFTLDINRSYLGETPLFIAARFGYSEVVKLLLAHAANPEIPMSRGVLKGHTPLSIAVYRGHLQVVQALLKVCSPDFTKLFNVEGQQAAVNLLDLAIAHPEAMQSEGHLAVFCLLRNRWVELRPDDVRVYVSRLMKADKVLELSTWQNFLKSAESVVPESGNTPLHVACKLGKLKPVKILLADIGVDINAKNKSGNTPLHLACDVKNVDVVTLLLGFKAMLDIVNDANETAFDVASRRHDERCLRALLKVRSGTQGQIPSLDIALTKGQSTLAKILYEGIQAQLSTENCIKIVEQALSLADIEFTVLVSKKILSADSQDARLRLLALLVEHPEQLLGVIALIGRELEAGCFKKIINTILNTETGNNLFHECCGRGFGVLIERLLNLGGDTQCRNHSGKTPLDLIADPVLRNNLLPATELPSHRPAKISTPPSTAYNRHRITSTELRTAGIAQKISARQATKKSKAAPPKKTALAAPPEKNSSCCLGQSVSMVAGAELRSPQAELQQATLSLPTLWLPLVTSPALEVNLETQPVAECALPLWSQDAEWRVSLSAQGEQWALPLPEWEVESTLLLEQHEAECALWLLELDTDRTLSSLRENSVWRTLFMEPSAVSTSPILRHEPLFLEAVCQDSHDVVPSEIDDDQTPGHGLQPHN